MFTLSNMQGLPPVAPPLAAVPAAAAGGWFAVPTLSSMSSELVPGPIILLLLLPALPLLLFSLGARPPDTDTLPFTTGDFFVTTACLTTAGAIGLGMAYWPDGLTGLGNWIKGGSIVTDAVNKLQRPPSSGSAAGYPAGNIQRRPPPRYSNGRHNEPASNWNRLAAQRQWGHPEWQAQAQAQGRVSPQRGGQAALHAPAETIASRSLNRLSALRQAFAPWYSPERPHLRTALIVCLLFLVLVTLAVGHWLGGAYDFEPAVKSSSSSKQGSGGSVSGDGKKASDKGSSGWVERELRKRKEEKSDPQKTIDRVAAETAKEREDRKTRQAKMKEKDFEKWRKAQEERRAKEIEKLREMLDAEGLEPIALPETDASAEPDKKDGDAGAETSPASQGEEKKVAEGKKPSAVDKFVNKVKATGAAIGRGLK